MKQLRDALDLKITGGKLAWKTAASCWILVTTMCSDMVNAKKRELRTREGYRAFRLPRDGELRALRLDGDVDLDHGVVSTTKALNARTGKVESTKTGETRRLP